MGLVSLPRSTGVSGVGQDLPHIDTPRIEVDDGYQPILVSRNIEDGKFANLVGTPIDCSHVGKPLPTRLFNHPIPGLQRPFCFCMGGPELAEFLHRNNAHGFLA